MTLNPDEDTPEMQESSMRQINMTQIVKLQKMQDNRLEGY